MFNTFVKQTEINSGGGLKNSISNRSGRMVGDCRGAAQDHGRPI